MKRIARGMLLLALVTGAGEAFAEAAGIDSREAFAPLGCGDAVTGEGAGCHVTNANAGLAVTLDGPANVGVGAAESGFYTASIPTGALDLLGSGINVAIDEPNATGCDLEAFSPGLTKFAPFDGGFGFAQPVLSHKGNDPLTNLIGQWSYQFLVLNCQTPGTMVLRVAMNAFDGSGDETGDVWNGTSLEVTVPEAGAEASGLAMLLALHAARRARR